MSLRRMRSGGMHAESELDFLHKIAKIEKQQKRKTYCQEPESFPGFYVNSSFTFDSFDKPQIFETTKKSHFILIMIDDFGLSPKRLLNMIENTDNCDAMTQSTNDDSYVWSAQPLSYDCIVHNYNTGQINHIFNIWILNTPHVNQTFKQCYYNLFEAYVCVNNSANIHFKQIYNEISQNNTKVQQFHIKENDEISPDRYQSTNFQFILKTLIDSTTF